MMMKSRFRKVGDVSEYLETIPKFSHSGSEAAHFGLDHVRKFCSGMDNPQDSVKMIHVAGTNGKGTTSQMLASVFQEAGYKTGLYTSPHLLEFNERIRVNSKVISDEEMLRFFVEAEGYLNEIPLTYFEIGTCMAFWHFSRSSCDIAIIEAGLGGRLDATNIIDPLISVITSVSVDHQDLLGTTVREIAMEKAGIIKPGRPVIAGNLCSDAMDPVKSRADDCGSQLILSSDYRPEWRSGKVVLTDPDNGSRLCIDGRGRKKIDRFNIASSLAAVQALEGQFPHLGELFTEGIENVDERFPFHAHFEQLHSVRRWYFDGAHNPEAMTTVFEQVSPAGDNSEPVFFLSFMRDKITPELLENFRPYKYVYYIERGIERNASCDQIRSILPRVTCINSENPGIGRILDSLKSELVIFTGSFYFYRQVKHWMASQPPSDHKKNSGLRP